MVLKRAHIASGAIKKKKKKKLNLQIQIFILQGRESLTENR